MKHPNLQGWQGEANIRQLNPQLLTEIQQILSRVKSQGQPYYQGKVDGIFGQNTLLGFTRYKSDRWLAHPEILGKTTADSLLEESDGEHVAMQEQCSPVRKLNPGAGSRSGKSMVLPTRQVVYANEFIFPGIPLTWGEFTKDCTRVLASKEHVENAIAYAKVWGWVRDKAGEPIGLTSGYRPLNINLAVGGSSRSQHLLAKAGDIYLLRGNNAKLYQICLASPFGGIGNGLCRGFVHTDIRGHRVVFGYGC